MSKDKIFFQGKMKTFIKLPDQVDDERIEFTVVVPKELRGKHLVISMASESHDVPAKSSCNEEDCHDCHVVYCPVYQGLAYLSNVGPQKICEKTTPVIPGHPNCHYGECAECGVVSCSRHQWDFQDDPKES